MTENAGVYEASQVYGVPYYQPTASNTTSEAQEHRIDYGDLMRLYEQAQHDLAVSEQGRLKAEEDARIHGNLANSYRDQIGLLAAELDGLKAAALGGEPPDNCPGCTDPRSEGTHVMGTRQHPTEAPA